MDQVSLKSLDTIKLMISAAIAHPTETIKCKLQLQMVQPDHLPRQFAGPVDVVRQTIQGQGITGMWKGVGASFIYRSCFAAMFGGRSLGIRLQCDRR
jgi:solute carrier family 25 carnitine/acylcarnitine transporter 20/29